MTGIHRVNPHSKLPWRKAFAIHLAEVETHLRGGARGYFLGYSLSQILRMTTAKSQNLLVLCLQIIGLELIDTLTCKYIENTQRKKHRLYLSQTLCGLQTFSNKIKCLAVHTTS